jgi:hypothetical protein
LLIVCAVLAESLPRRMGVRLVLSDCLDLPRGFADGLNLVRRVDELFRPAVPDIGDLGESAYRLMIAGKRIDDPDEADGAEGSCPLDGLEPFGAPLGSRFCLGRH